MSEPNARILELWFYAVFGGDNHDRAGWSIATNLSLASRNSYDRDPSGIAELIEDNDRLSLRTLCTLSRLDCSTRTGRG